MNDEVSAGGERLRRANARGMPIELGAHSPRIERVRDLRTSRGRREQGQFAIEGPTLIAEALAAGVSLQAVYGVRETLERIPAVAVLESAALPFFVVPERLYARLSDLESPSGVLAVGTIPTVDPAELLSRPGTLVLFAGLNDPGNAGTLLRSAEAFGACGALFGRGGVDAYAPKVVRSAMGALFRLPIANVDAEWLVAAAAAAGRPIVAADTAGGDIEESVVPRDIVLAIGNERRGVRDWLPRWDLMVGVRQQGSAESLNAAVAGSILLYRLARPR